MLRDLIGLSFSVALPWIAGALCVRALAPAVRAHWGAIAIGYGYFVGLFGITVAMRLADAIGQPWSVVLVATPVAALGAGAYFRVSRLPDLGLARAAGAIAAMPPFARWVFVLLLLATVARVIMLGLQVVWTPLVPLDTWAQWASKARVWFEYGRMVPFVSATDWGKAAGVMHFMDTHPDYPGTVPLFQVWTALCLGRWDDSLVNLPWLAGFVALGIGFYAQIRRLGVSALKAMLGTWLLLSLPFLTIYVALAGLADIFVTAAYGLAAMALWQWVSTRQWQDAALALAMAVLCATVKLEGILWLLTLAPGVVVALNRRLGLALVAVAALMAVAFLTFGPSDVRIFNYALRTRFENVSGPVFQHLFVMDNWHLLWYATVVIIAANYRLLLRAALAPASVTMLAAIALILIVFSFSSASRGVEDQSLTNRLPLHIVPALVFYLAMILRQRFPSSVAPGAGPIDAERSPVSRADRADAPVASSG